MQNIAILAGRIGQDPEGNTVDNDTYVARFSLATSRPRYKNGKVVRGKDGYRVQDTEWHRITCFNGLGKTVQEYCTKGMSVLVRGRIHYSTWTDKDGVERYSTEIIAETVDFLSRAKDAEGAADDRQDDDIPF